MRHTIGAGGRYRVGAGCFVALYLAVLWVSPVCAASMIVAAPAAHEHSQHLTPHSLCSLLCSGQAGSGILPALWANLAVASRDTLAQPAGRRMSPANRRSCSPRAPPSESLDQ